MCGESDEGFRAKPEFGREVQGLEVGGGNADGDRMAAKLDERIGEYPPEYAARCPAPMIAGNDSLDMDAVEVLISNAGHKPVSPDHAERAGIWGGAVDRHAARNPLRDSRVGPIEHAVMNGQITPARRLTNLAHAAVTSMRS